MLLRRSYRELSRTATSVLATLRDTGPRRVTDLAATESVAQPTMTALVVRLERDGLVERGSDAADGRAVLVSITDEGLVELLFTSYFAVTGAAMLVTRFMSSRIGPKRTMLAGLALVVVFSALAGASGSVGEIVGFRAGWGLGNALFIATALSVIIGAASGGVSGAIRCCWRRWSSTASARAARSAPRWPASPRSSSGWPPARAPRRSSWPA